MTPKRHWVLSVICILTFIGSGFGLLISVLSIISIDLIWFIKNIPLYTSVATNISDSHFSYSILKAALYIFSVLGAFYMWKLKKKGFFMYSAAQLLLPLISFFYFPYPKLQVLTIVLPEYIFAFAFIALYALHLGSMTTGRVNLNSMENHE